MPKLSSLPFRECIACDIQNHRLKDVLDHPDGSVTLDKLSDEVKAKLGGGDATYSKEEFNAYVDEQHEELWHDASFVAYECFDSTITPNAGPSGETKYLYSYDVTELLPFVNGGCKVVFGGDTYEPRVTYNSQYTRTALLMPRNGGWGAMSIENKLNTITSKYSMTLTIEATQGYVPPEDLTLYINPSGERAMKIRAEAIPDYVSKTYVDNAFSEAKGEIINEVLAEFVDVSEVGQ